MHLCVVYIELLVLKEGLSTAFWMFKCFPPAKQIVCVSVFVFHELRARGPCSILFLSLYLSASPHTTNEHFTLIFISLFLCINSRCCCSAEFKVAQLRGYGVHRYAVVRRHLTISASPCNTIKDLIAANFSIIPNPTDRRNKYVGRSFIFFIRKLFSAKRKIPSNF